MRRGVCVTGGYITKYSARYVYIVSKKNINITIE